MKLTGLVIMPKIYLLLLKNENAVGAKLTHIRHLACTCKSICDDTFITSQIHENIETWKSGNLEIWKSGNLEACGRLLKTIIMSWSLLPRRKKDAKGLVLYMRAYMAQDWLVVVLLLCLTQ